jgi:hypothetical protein
MLVARAYTVLDAVVVEVSCVHTVDPAGSHLVIREERRGVPVDEVGALRTLADVCDMAASLVCAQRQGAEGPQLEECRVAWVSPCG